MKLTSPSTRRLGLIAVLLGMLWSVGLSPAAQDTRPATAPANPSATRPAASRPTTRAIVDDDDEPPALTTAAAVRALSAAEAARQIPVRLRGTITYIVNQPSILFLQDATGGVCVVGPRDLPVKKFLRVGAVITVEGVTGPGRATACVVPKGKDPLAIEFIQQDAVPPARPTTVAELTGSTTRHGEYVEVSGVVRSVRTEPIGPGGQQDATVMSIASPSGARLEVASLALNAAAVLPKAWVGAVVRFRGVFNSSAPEKQHPAAMRLLLGAAKDANVTTPAVAPEKLAVTPVAQAESPEAARQARTRVKGVVTVAVPGKGAYVQDATGGVWVEPPAAPATAAVAPTTAPAPAAARAGDLLDVVGFTVRRQGSAVIEDAAWTSAGPMPMPDPARISADEALSGTYHARLVSLDALVLEVSRLSEGQTLVLQAGERVFLARLVEAGDGTAAGTTPAENSWVRVRGVCVNNHLPAAPGENGGGGDRPVSFHVLLAGPSAVTVVRGPTWWTLEKVLIGTVIALLAAVAAMGWVIALRRRVARQTNEIARQAHRHTLNEERMRIARELHDSLEQDLLGITLQLKATEKLLDRPVKAKESLVLASAMVRRSQAETHRAVWDLRERKAGQEGLVPALRQAVAGLATAAAVGGGNGNGSAAGDEGPDVQVVVDGTERELPPQTENHLLRVALEAVTNAFKHAGAKSIKVLLSFERARVTLCVGDDGKGFDPAHAPPPNSGHFGLFGMTERAAKLHGKLSVSSKPGEGTRIVLVVPTPADAGSAVIAR